MRDCRYRPTYIFIYSSGYTRKVPHGSRRQITKDATYFQLLVPKSSLQAPNVDESCDEEDRELRGLIVLFVFTHARMSEDVNLHKSLGYSIRR
jgi:hypothetical protein